MGTHTPIMGGRCPVCSTCQLVGTLPYLRVPIVGLSAGDSQEVRVKSTLDTFHPETDAETWSPVQSSSIPARNNFVGN